MNLLGKSCNHSYKKFISYIISFCRKNAKFKSPKTCLKNLHRHYLAKRSINYSIIYNNTWHLGILRLILWRGAALKLASRQAQTLPESGVPIFRTGSHSWRVWSIILRPRNSSMSAYQRERGNGAHSRGKKAREGKWRIFQMKMSSKSNEKQEMERQKSRKADRFWFLFSIIEDAW